ncbi:MAG: NtaA/DmoA family FMN-dependent monooxygenase [Bacillota bacterium]|uniref:NtaA/DmoA family FMN-dependent monooxygenase n=1 Tax=Virgibacillus salarius TaxID=447199 RepID=A0A941DS56_9BACI|nr:MULTISPECIES: NtaA/DmoA family FMN-dependent monooxygenase [Virgibacillus]NAZ07234.1 NtaA/DmoA family FMN-dependent monooxygenase [Agaribacter marinus]MBR7794512.1 NtaA/DmoA family FMN-dependent monooxygenase [Virgibacillus salarius]MCC2249499.1 NtaA/DmoA family FMN-dependent monooxygenase [Virgibacillus sp. AGTR]MDY7043303.1 NtaA/DmoA family FMN-dependent monooxygenase [Virgibacillus sp. M23]QRZ17864.1 NtaA/DmoA family FMN-dependent monooxygenase [Virgibacillus sp. AGTR]
MTTNRQLCIGLSLSTTWMKGNGWRHTDSGVENLYSSDFYVQLAKMAEEAKLDFIFRPDTLFLNKEVLGNSPGFGSLDPTLLLTSIARETNRIGLVTTASTTFNSPYTVARQLQSLQWISNGRAGWNIVTSIEGAGNFGDDPMPSSPERYQKASEFTDIVRKLWDSYPNESLVINRSTGQYADKEMVSPINHSGDFFSVEGPLNVPAHKSGTIPLFQAGASESGRNFAASVADAIFAATPDMASGIELRDDLRRRAKKHGRHPSAIRVLPGLYFFLANTREEALELHRKAHAHLSQEHRYASVKSILGMDISTLPLDQSITVDMLPDQNQSVRSRTHADLLRRLITRQQPTVEELLSRPEVVGSAHWVVVGTVEDALNEITEWFETGAADGFIALPGGSKTSMELFFSELMPMLVERGLFRSEYTGSTLREHLGIT